MAQILGTSIASRVPRANSNSTTKSNNSTLQSYDSESIEIEENNDELNKLLELYDYVQEQCVNQRRPISFDELKETDEYKAMLTEAGLDENQFSSYADFLSQIGDIESKAYLEGSGINSDNYQVSGNTDEYLSDVTSLISDLDTQIDYYNDYTTSLSNSMDKEIESMNITNELTYLLSDIDRVNSELYSNNPIDAYNNDTSFMEDLYDYLSSYQGFPDDYEINKEYSIDGLSFKIDENGNLNVTKIDTDTLSNTLTELQTEFSIPNRYSSEVVNGFMDEKFNWYQEQYISNQYVIDQLNDQKISTVVSMYEYSIDEETGETILNPEFEAYFKENFTDVDVYTIYEAMLDQSNMLEGFDTSFYDLTDYMDANQLAVFEYIYGTQGADAALEYVKMFESVKQEQEAMHKVYEEMETMIDWPESISNYSDAIDEVTDYISEHYDETTDWKEFAQSDEFQEYLTELAYNKYLYENEDCDLDIDDWKESNSEYLSAFLESVNQYNDSTTLISALLEVDSEISYNYIYEKLSSGDADSIELKNNFETVCDSILGGFGEGTMSGLSLFSPSRWTSTQTTDEMKNQYIAAILAKSKGLNTAYQVSDALGAMLPSMYIGMIGGAYISEVSNAVVVTSQGESTLLETSELAQESLTTFEKAMQYSGSAMYGIDMLTNTYHNSRISGESIANSIKKALVDSAIQTGILRVVGTIPGLSAADNTIYESTSQAFKAYFTKCLQQGGTMALTNYVTAGANAAIDGGSINLDELNDEAKSSFITGFLLGAITNVGTLANVEEPTVKLKVDGITYEVTESDFLKAYDAELGKLEGDALTSAQENPEAFINEHLQEILQTSSATGGNTVSLSTKAQGYIEKYNLSDEQARKVEEMVSNGTSEEIASTMVKYEVSQEVAELMVNQGLTEEEAMEFIKSSAETTSTGSVVTEEQDIDMKASILAEQLEIDEKVAKAMIKYNTTEEIASTMVKYEVSQEVAELTIEWMTGGLTEEIALEVAKGTISQEVAKMIIEWKNKGLTEEVALEVAKETISTEAAEKTLEWKNKGLTEEVALEVAKGTISQEVAEIMIENKINVDAKTAKRASSIVEKFGYELSDAIKLTKAKINDDTINRAISLSKTEGNICTSSKDIALLIAGKFSEENIVEIITQYRTSSDMEIDTALSNYAAQIIGYSGNETLNSTLASQIIQSTQGVVTAVPGSYEVTGVSEIYLKNFGNLTESDITILNEIANMINQIQANELYTDPNAKDPTLNAYSVKKIASVIATEIEQSENLSEIFKKMEGKTLEKTIEEVIKGAAGISNPKSVDDTLIALLSNYFFWDESITSQEELTTKIQTLFGFTNDEMKSFVSVDSKGKIIINEEIFKNKGINKNLTNEEIRLLYNYVEAQIKEKVGKETDLYKRAELSYEARNDLRQFMQGLAYGQNTLPGKGTNKWINTFESAFVYNGLTDDDVLGDSIAQLSSNESKLSESAKDALKKIQKSKCDKDVVKDLYGSFSESDIAFLNEYFKNDEDCKNAISENLFESAFSANPGVNASLGLEIKEGE